MASVLVVDDEPDIRYLTQVNLELDGHRVMTAADGADALAAVEVELPDVILLDVLMPGVSGWEVLEQLKAHLDDKIAAVKVLMMTALGDDDDRLRGGIEGAVGYLIKPVSPDTLRSAIEDALSGGSEREQRRRAQTGALTELARIQRGDQGAESSQTDNAEVAGPRLSRLEHARPRTPDSVVADGVDVIGDKLTDKQAEMLRAVQAASSVSSAAAGLGVSRSNVYASLRRVARKVELDSVPELLHRLRTGQIVVDDGR